MLVYNKETGEICNWISDDQDPKIFYRHRSKDFLKNLATLDVEDPPIDLYRYRVIDNQLIRKSDEEINEIQIYGRVLTSEERILEQIKPSFDEVKKAEMTVEVLSLLQEVM